MLQTLFFKILILGLCLTLIRGQTVANQCLAEQVRNNRLNNQRIPVTAEQITIDSFDAICRNYREYTDCFTTRLPNGNQVADQYLRLVFQERNLLTAYRGLCTLDLETLRPVIRCLLSTPQVRQCYAAFNAGVGQVVNLLNQNRLPRATVQNLACNNSVTRYRCETAVYGLCNQQAGRIMQDFFFASVTPQCRRTTGITSRYTTLFNASIRPSSPCYFIYIVVSLFSSILSSFIKYHEK